jgi:hypothetical protein
VAQSGQARQSKPTRTATHQCTIERNEIIKGETMSNARGNKEQDQKVEWTPNQQNPGACKATDWTVEDNATSTQTSGQHGDTKRERRRLLAEIDEDGKSKLGQPIADRHVAGGVGSR